MALSAPSCVAFLPSLGVLFRGTVRVVRSKMVEFFLLQKWIDLDELNPMVWVPSIVRRRIDFSLAVFKLRALRAVHPYNVYTTAIFYPRVVGEKPHGRTRLIQWRLSAPLVRTRVCSRPEKRIRSTSRILARKRGMSSRRSSPKRSLEPCACPRPHSASGLWLMCFAEQAAVRRVRQTRRPNQAAQLLQRKILQQ